MKINHLKFENYKFQVYHRKLEFDLEYRAQMTEYSEG